MVDLNKVTRAFVSNPEGLNKESIKRLKVFMYESKEEVQEEKR